MLRVFRLVIVAVVAGLVSASTPAPAQEAGSQSGIVKPAPTQFDKVPGAPDCFTASAQDGDPGKGPSVLVLRGTAGCTVPWHWHSPNEQLMMIGGSGRFQMKGDKPVLLRAGGYALTPSKHVHQFSCAGACMFFLRSDGPFDIHYVDASGKEIPLEEALKSAPAPPRITNKP
jgi:quercetin dioxygenase-like cupin family protein